MWFMINIIEVIICFVTRLFCVITTFKALKYPDYFYEANPIVKKLLKCKKGKILTVILGFTPLFILFIFNFIIPLELILILTISISVLLIVCLYDFFTDMSLFGYYKKIKREN